MSASVRHRQGRLNPLCSWRIREILCIPQRGARTDKERRRYLTNLPVDAAHAPLPKIHHHIGTNADRSRDPVCVDRFHSSEFGHEPGIHFHCHSVPPGSISYRRPRGWYVGNATLRKRAFDNFCRTVNNLAVPFVELCSWQSTRRKRQRGKKDLRSTQSRSHGLVSLVDFGDFSSRYGLRRNSTAKNQTNNPSRNPIPIANIHASLAQFFFPDSGMSDIPHRNSTGLPSAPQLHPRLVDSASDVAASGARLFVACGDVFDNRTSHKARPRSGARKCANSAALIPGSVLNETDRAVSNASFRRRRSNFVRPVTAYSLITVHRAS